MMTRYKVSSVHSKSLFHMYHCWPVCNIVIFGPFYWTPYGFDCIIAEYIIQYCICNIQYLNMTQKSANYVPISWDVLYNFHAFTYKRSADNFKVWLVFEGLDGDYAINPIMALSGSD